MPAMLRKETTGNIVYRSPKNQNPSEQHTQLQMSTQIHTIPGTQMTVYIKGVRL